MPKNQIGRIAMREEGTWWVAYYALPDTMEKALEIGRIRISIVLDLPQVKEQFMELMRYSIAHLVPEFELTEARPAPESERSGHG